MIDSEPINAASQAGASVPQKQQHDFYRWQQDQEERRKDRLRVVAAARRRTRSESDARWTWKTACLAVGLLHYAAWVTTLVCCSPALLSVRTEGGVGGIANSTRDGGVRPSLFFPLDVYAWSVGQSLSTLGILEPISEVLTREAWKSFEKRDRRGERDENGGNDGGSDRAVREPSILPPTEIPVLDVQDFLGTDDDGSAALEFLETTYGPRWNERPLLLRGLWTVDELLPASTTTSSYSSSTATRRRQRRLTPEGLLNTTDLVVPYFSDATRPGALQPDATAPVGAIVRGMIEEERPHKIGSQFVVQNDPSLMEEVAPLTFLRGLFGNHFSPDHLMGNPHRRGIRRFVPGTTTVPLFVANTRAVRRRRRRRRGPEPAQDDEETPAECPVPAEDSDGDGSCPNPRSDPNNDDDDDDDGFLDDPNDKIPVTGLHCEPIANVAVQLWGSRTWTLVDPEHSWKLKPSISRDGRSFYPSWISSEDLAATVPRYVTTTTPGDALWLPTWTYHKVDYVYHDDDDDEEIGSRSQRNDGADAQLRRERRLHAHHLSIGASLFHFRPIDYVRRNPLFALLLIPSLVRELAGIKTQ